MNDRPEQERAGKPADGDDVEDMIAVARVARPQGHRGEVIADLLTDFPERFARLGRAYVKLAGGRLLTLDLESARPHKGRVALKFAGYDDMNRAEELRDARVLITRDQLVKLPEGVYYNFDLIGCEVEDRAGRPVGRVEEVQNYGAAPLLAVRSGGRELLIPLATSICVEVDIGRKRIVVDPPEGLLDL
jgi:16S rRNA processing protein RimM